MTGTASTLLDDPSALRLLDEHDAPYGGRLHAGDPPTVWVDVRALPDAVWGFAPGGHVLVPLDVARTREGHAAILPHCPRRLRDVEAGGRPGEIVTIVVSMIRAAQQARERSVVAGAWWVDASGRPVLAVGGSREWAVEAGEVIDVLGADAGPLLREALGDAEQLIRAGRLREEDAARCEDRLFAVAEPTAVGAGPRRSDAFGALVSGEPAPRRADSVNAAAQAGPAETWLGRFTDSEWASRVASAVRSVVAWPTRAKEMWSRSRTDRSVARRRRARGRDAVKRGDGREVRTPQGRPEGRASRGGSEPRRRAPWLIAAGVGIVVMVAGLAWPDGESSAPGREANAVEGRSETPDASAPTGASPVTDGEASSSSPVPETSPAARSAGDAPSADPTDGAGPVAGTRVALRALRDCASADACGQIFEEPAHTSPDGLVVHATDATRVTLLDEYGGIAVLRLEDAGHDAQILVMVSNNGKWLVRDVYDVADQP